jgi:hypothetical protein
MDRVPDEVKDRIAELRKLTEEATPGPWRATTLDPWETGPEIYGPDPLDGKGWTPVVSDHGTPANLGGGIRAGHDARLIAAMRNALPALLDVAVTARAAWTLYRTTLTVRWPSLERLGKALARLEGDGS